MDLQQLKYFNTSIEDEMLSDSESKSIYKDIKQNLIYKNGVVYDSFGGMDYRPRNTIDVVKTSGVSFHDSITNRGDISNELIIAQNNDHMLHIAKSFNDAYSVTSSGTPSYLTTIWTTEQYKVITRATVFDQVSHSFQQGMFGITNIKIPTISYAGMPALYADHSVQGTSAINTNWEDRQVVNFEHMLVYGDLTISQMAMGKIDYINSLRTGVLEQIKLHQDAIGFFGYSTNMQIFGLLNDPSLYPTITAYNKTGAPAGSVQTMWMYANYFEVIADIGYMYSSIVSRAGGNVGYDEECYLLLPPDVWTLLISIVSPLGNMTVHDYLIKNFPKMKLIQAPLLQGTGNPIGSTTPNQAVLIFDKVKGQKCLLNAFVTLYNSHGVMRLASSYQEKISYSLGGAIVANGIGLQIMTGI